MHTRYSAFVTPLVATALVAPTLLAQSSAPPVAPKRPHATTIHGITLNDDYFWLREKSNPDVITYLEAENAYTEGVMAPLKGLQERLYAEMLGRIKQTDLSVPSRIGEYFYYSRTEEGKQYAYVCRRRGSMEAPEEILLDLNQLAEGQKFLGLGATVVSNDGNLLAFSTDTTGYRQYVLQVKDLRSGQILPHRIERTGAVVWAADNKTLFYTTEDAVSKRSTSSGGTPWERPQAICCTRRRTSSSTSTPDARSIERSSSSPRWRRRPRSSGTCPPPIRRRR
jgi:oligopeptidase B